MAYFSCRVCPSVFIYLSSVVPAIWFLELHEMEKRIDDLVRNNNTQEIRNETSEELSANLGTVFGVSVVIRPNASVTKRSAKHYYANRYTSGLLLLLKCDRSQYVKCVIT